MLIKGKTSEANDVLLALEKACPKLFQVAYENNQEQSQVGLVDLVRHIKASTFEFESLKPVCLAQWMLESGRGTSSLFKTHCNAGGLKWRPEMDAVASPVDYNASDGIGTYCHFNSLADWIRGYWIFIDRSPYRGWRKAAESGPRSYISFIAARGYAEDEEYVAKVLKLIPEAESLLGLPRVDKIKILIDPGHSESEPGTRSIDQSAEEEDLNRLQAQILADLLKSKYDCEIYDPETDDLCSIGERAIGKRIFISLHHNSYDDGQEDPGTEIFITRGDDVSRKLAENVLEALCLALNSTNRGVKEKNYTVIAEASNFCEGPVMLIESYFLNPYSKEQAIERSTKAAEAIASSLLQVD